MLKAESIQMLFGCAILFALQLILDKLFQKKLNLQTNIQSIYISALAALPFYIVSFNVLCMILAPQLQYQLPGQLSEPGKMKGKDESTVLQNFLFMQQNPQEIFSFCVTEDEQVLIQVEVLVKMERNSLENSAWRLANTPAE